MNICVVGDSHTASLRDGFAAVQHEFPDCRVVFFAGLGDSLNDLTVADGRLVAGSPRLLRLFKLTSGGEEGIGPHFDAYLLVGLDIRMLRAGQLCLSRLRKRERAGRSEDLSDEKFQHVVVSDFAKTLAEDVMTKLRLITDAPTFFVATPHPGESAETDIWAELKEYEYLDRVVRVYGPACEVLCAAHDVRFLPQPKETIAANGVATLERYTRGATAVVEKVSDDTHMNAEYGAIILRAALHAMAASGPR